MDVQSGRESGYVWELGDAVSRAELEPILAQFPDLERLAGAQVLKRNHYRTVFHVAEPLGLIVKAYRYTSSWDRLLYRVLCPRARKEWLALRRFQALGLPVPSPMAVAHLLKGRTFHGGGLILSFLPGTEPLSSRLRFLLEDAGGRHDDAGSRAAPLPEEARGLLVRAASLVRQLHDGGIWHRDLHSGNLLYSRKEGRIYFIDLHSCIFRRRLARWQRRQGVVKLLHSLQGTIPPEGVRVFLDAYGLRKLFPRGGAERAEQAIARATRALERKRLRSRSRRCFLPSSRFEVEKRRGLRYYRLRELPAQELAALWTREPPGECLKRSPDGWVAALETSGGTRVCVKYRACSFREMLQSLVESHRLRRAYAAGHALWVRKLPSPQVVALRERTFLGMVREAFLVTELLPEAVPLDRYLLEEYWGKRVEPGPAARRKHALARRAGAFVRALHDAGLYPHDLSPQNLLLQPGFLGDEESPAAGPFAGLYLVDLDHVYLWQPLWWRGRRNNLAQAANLPEGHVSTPDRLRALKAYARLAPGERENLYWRREWIRSLRARVLKEHAHVLESMIRREHESVKREGRAP